MILVILIIVSLVETAIIDTQDNNVTNDSKSTATTYY